MAHTYYSSTAKCRTKLPAIFRNIFGIFRRVSKIIILFIPSLVNTGASKQQSFMFSHHETPRVNDRVKQAAKLFIYTFLFHLFAWLIVRVRLMLFSN